MADLKGIEARLRDKERELSLDIARLEAEARDVGGAGVQDAADDAASAEGGSESLLEGSLASQTLTEVQDALRRLAAGTWGKCIVCGRPIEPARLEAVPWASRCLKDQDKEDRAAQVPQGGSTL
jgi:DnaK suppressor protein